MTLATRPKHSLPLSHALAVAVYASDSPRLLPLSTGLRVALRDFDLAKERLAEAKKDVRELSSAVAEATTANPEAKVALAALQHRLDLAKSRQGQQHARVTTLRAAVQRAYDDVRRALEHVRRTVLRSSHKQQRHHHTQGAQAPAQEHTAASPAAGPSPSPKAVAGGSAKGVFTDIELRGGGASTGGEGGSADFYGMEGLEGLLAEAGEALANPDVE